MRSKVLSAMRKGDDVRLRARAEDPPSPFVVEPSQHWDGNDGSWSSFYIRVGEPEQKFRIFPATNAQETWIPMPEGCSSTDPPDCGARRGVELFQNEKSNGFQTNKSSTWTLIGLYDLAIEDKLGFSGVARYGFDTVGLGESNPWLAEQLVGGVATKDFYLGIFGLGPKPAEFTGSPIPSYMKTLKDRNLIPSLSFGYTAGAYYRLNSTSGLKGVFGSLVLGGYDSPRLAPNNISFSFANGGLGNLTVGLQSITISNTLEGTIAPLEFGIYAQIDSMTSQIWLPVQACDALERAFGLTYDSNTDFYLVNETVRERLLELNPTFTFKLGNAGDGEDFVNINVPYSAFDQQASSPIYSSPKNYFPLRRAANATQYTLGRTFLQEAYLTVDYETSNFSVSQANFKNDNPPQIVPINHLVPISNSSSNTAKLKSSHSLTSGGIAGIVLSAITVLIVTGAFVFFVRRQRKAPLPLDQDPEPKRSENSYEVDGSTNILQFAPAECDASIPLERPPRPELEEAQFTSGWRRPIELNNVISHELP